MFIRMLFESLDIAYTYAICIYECRWNIYFMKKKKPINRMIFFVSVSFTFSRWRGMKFVTDIITVKPKKKIIKTHTTRSIWITTIVAFIISYAYHIDIHWVSIGITWAYTDARKSIRYYRTTEFIIMKRLCKFIEYSVFNVIRLTGTWK